MFTLDNVALYAVKFPEIFIFPKTSNLATGCVEPIPTFPFTLTFPNTSNLAIGCVEPIPTLPSTKRPPIGGGLTVDDTEPIPTPKFGDIVIEFVPDALKN